MSKEVFLVVEGLTEQLFCDNVLAPYLAQRGIYLHTSQIKKKGAKGGDVRYVRAKTSITAYLKQRPDTIVGTFFDYYGLKEWPELDAARANTNLRPAEIEERLVSAAKADLISSLPEIDVASRFRPFIAIHEFEALLYSDPGKLSDALCINRSLIDAALTECGSPESVNTSPQTAPSKRILAWTANRYGKASQGPNIAAQIGIDTIRAACPIFDGWLASIEK